MLMSKQPRSDNNKDKQALKEAKMVAELAPDAKTRREAQGVIETIEDNIPTVQEQEQQVIENNLSETKKIITKTANQANREIPKYTEALAELSKDTIKANKEIGLEYIELQRELSNLIPRLQERYVSYFFPWFSPAVMAENNTKLVDNFVQNGLAATNLMNNLAMINFESIQSTLDTNREYCKVGVDNARRLTQTLSRQISLKSD
jgi:hypothetical protein